MLTKICCLFLFVPSLLFAQRQEELYNQACDLYDYREYKSALKFIDEAIHLCPDSVKYLVKRAKTFEQMDKVDRALHDYALAIKLDSTNEDVIMAKGLLHANNGDYKDADKAFSRLIALNPKNEEALLNRAFARKLNNDKKGAAEDIGRAMSLNSNYSDDGIIEGIDKFFSDDNEGACAAWRKVHGIAEEQAKNLITLFCK